MPDDGLTASPCTMCNKPTDFSCTICDSARYCSKECQKSDWQLHGLLCKGYRLIASVLRPTELHKMALLFPVDDETPRLVFIRTIKTEHAPIAESPNVYMLQFGTATNLGAILRGPVGPSNTMFYNPIRDVNLGHRLVFTRVKDFDKLPVNKCAIEFLGDKAEELGRFWKGPIIVTSETDVGGGGVGDDDEVPVGGAIFRVMAFHEVHDITLADVRHAVDGLSVISEAQLKRLAAEKRAKHETWMGIVTKELHWKNMEKWMDTLAVSKVDDEESGYEAIDGMSVISDAQLKCLAAEKRAKHEKCMGIITKELHWKNMKEWMNTLAMNKVGGEESGYEASHSKKSNAKEDESDAMESNAQENDAQETDTEKTNTKETDTKDTDTKENDPPKPNTSTPLPSPPPTPPQTPPPETNQPTNPTALTSQITQLTSNLAKATLD